MSQAARAEPVAVLVVRAWRHGAQVVARVTTTTDVERSEPVTAAVAGIDEIAAAVEHWLDDLAAGRDEPVTDT
jgi:hypothetical protein